MFLKVSRNLKKSISFINLWFLTIIYVVTFLAYYVFPRVHFPFLSNFVDLLCQLGCHEKSHSSSIVNTTFNVDWLNHYLSLEWPEILGTRFEGWNWFWQQISRPKLFFFTFYPVHVHLWHQSSNLVKGSPYYPYIFKTLDHVFLCMSGGIGIRWW